MFGGLVELRLVGHMHVHLADFLGEKAFKCSQEGNRWYGDSHPERCERSRDLPQVAKWQTATTKSTSSLATGPSGGVADPLAAAHALAHVQGERTRSVASRSL